MNTLANKNLLLPCTLLLFYLTQPFSLFSQNPLIIYNYDKKDYQAGNQNWSVCMGHKNVLYSANNYGLLYYDGATWRLKTLPANTTIRSVLAINNRVYIGTFEDFGYFEIKENGIGDYISLAKVYRKDLKNEEFWRIAYHQGNVFFQSFGTIYYLNEADKVERLPINFSVLLLMEVGNQLFTQSIQGGLYRVSTSGLTFIKGSEIFGQTEVKSGVVIQGDTIFVTTTMGLYKFDGKSFYPWNTNIDNELIKSNPNVAVSVNDFIAFGTILNGIYIINKNGKILHHIDSKSIQNNTILSIEADSSGNLWVGKDKGISYISFNSPITTYINESEKYACYSGTLFKSKLYLATNQGIYEYEQTPNDFFVNKKLIQGTQGQSWFAKQIAGKLYFGLNNGTYIYENITLTKICNVSGGYNLERLGSEHELYIQSTYRNLVTYKLEKGKLRVENIIPNFLSPIRFLQVDYQNYIWLGHTVTGIFKAQASRDISYIQKIDTIGILHNLNFSTNRIYKLENRIVIPSEKGILRWDDISLRFIPFNDLNIQLQGFETCKAIISLPGSLYWLIKDDEWGLFEIRYGQVKLLYRVIPDAYGIELVEGYENIVAINDSTHLFCLDNGFALLNLDRVQKLSDSNQQPTITEVSAWNGPDTKTIVEANSKGIFIVPWRKNNVTFSFTSKDIIGIKHYYQYKLKGVDKSWSNWETSTNVDYKRLPPGNYEFLVRTLNPKGQLSPPSKINIEVKPPFLASWKAFLIYLLLAIAITVFTRVSYRRKVRKQYEQKRKEELEKIEREKEEQEKIIIKLQNEKLQTDIEYKNSQLALNTMAIIRKNQLLQDIATELENLKDELGYRIPNKYYNRITKLITQNIESEHDWKIFEQLFDQAHHDFFKRLKKMYPALTPSDLRLCAYLRLNLSSKEIAPLLNITIRGVEERRYRLRKRLELGADDNLNDFILRF